MAYTAFTKANAADIMRLAPIGTRVRFEYGAMCGSSRGIVVDYGSDRWHDFFLVCAKEDGSEQAVHGFSDVGIGVYLDA